MYVRDDEFKFIHDHPLELDRDVIKSIPEDIYLKVWKMILDKPEIKPSEIIANVKDRKLTYLEVMCLLDDLWGPKIDTDSFK